MAGSIFGGGQGYSFGEAVYPKGGRYGPLRQSYMSLLMIHEGEAMVAADGLEQRVGAGRTACVYNRTSLAVSYRRGLSTWVSWCETLPAVLSEDSRRRLRALPFHIPTTDRLADLQRTGVRLGLASDPNLNSLRNSVGEAVFNAYFYEAQLAEFEQPVPSSVLQARRFLEANFARSCDLKTVAAAARLSPQHLIHAFRKHFKTTPARYLWQLRAAKGASLLRQTGLTVAEIAYQCGYKNPYHFSRQIKASYGIPPTELRRRKGYRDSSLRIEKADDVLF